MLKASVEKWFQHSQDLSGMENRVGVVDLGFYWDLWYIYRLAQALPHFVVQIFMC